MDDVFVNEIEQQMKQMKTGVDNYKTILKEIYLTECSKRNRNCGSDCVIDFVTAAIATISIASAAALRKLNPAEIYKAEFLWYGETNGIFDMINIYATSYGNIDADGDVAAINMGIGWTLAEYLKSKKSQFDSKTYVIQYNEWYYRIKNEVIPLMK